MATVSVVLRFICCKASRSQKFQRGLEVHQSLQEKIMIRANSSSKLAVLVLVLCLAVALAPSAFGQAISGNLTGTVTDPSGAAINNATVTATNDATGQRVSTVSSGTGGYLFTNLPVGTYKVSATSSG